LSACAGFRVRESAATIIGNVGRVRAPQPALINAATIADPSRAAGIAVAEQVFPVLSKGPVPKVLARGHCRRSRQEIKGWLAPALSHLVNWPPSTIRTEPVT
jgi:hypothetical protein